MNSSPVNVLMQGYVLATGSNIGFSVGYKRFYFVLTDQLSYYETKESFESESPPVGVISLEVFSLSVMESLGVFQFAVHAYPMSVECLVDSSQTLREWEKGFSALSEKSYLPNFSL